MATKITKEIILDLLCKNSVSVKTVEKATIDAVKREIGTSRKAYANSPIGRQQIVEDIPEEYATAVFAVWGDMPTVDDPEPPAIETKEE